MKIGRIISAVVLVLLCGLGWFVQISAMTSSNAQYLAELETARDHVARGLYQRAIQNYESTLSICEDNSIRTEMLEVYAQAYSEREITRNTYRNALEKACDLYPKESGYWEQLVELLRDVSNYNEASKALSRAERAGASSERLAGLSREIQYAFTTSSHIYTEIHRAPSGYTTVYNGSGWGVIAPNGNRDYDCDYQYISPYSDDGSALFRTEETSRLLDARLVVQAIISEDISEARACGDNLLPIFADGKWCYLDCENESLRAGQYDDASSFQDGTAVVRQGAAWTLIDMDGNTAVEHPFTDIKLHGNGDYSYGGLMIACADGQWGIYQSNGTEVADFSARDMDVYLGDYIAYQDASGLWGFVDRKGNIVIEPRFAQAKSFSGGLAAVFDGSSWGFVNNKGELAVDYQFADAGYFSGKGVCLVSDIDSQYYAITLRFPAGS